MYIIGITGPIGHGKTSFAEALAKLVPVTVLLETSSIIIKVADKLNQKIKPGQTFDSLESINLWLADLPSILNETMQTKPEIGKLLLTEQRIAADRNNYSKLFEYIEQIKINPDLVRVKIDNGNKSSYRAILQWLGSFLRITANKYIWYNELISIADSYKEKGTQLCVISGLRFPEDGETIKNFGGLIITIHRPAIFEMDSIDPTESERQKVKYDVEVINDGNLPDLDQTAQKFYRDYINNDLSTKYSSSGI